MKSGTLAGLTAALLLWTSAVARANVTISNHTTKNMSCSAGVCTATARDAVLNVTDLVNMLAAGDVAVKTGSIAKDISIDQPLTWSSTSRLTLDAQRSVTINKQVTVAGQGALTITYNDGESDGDLYFFGKGQMTFANLSSSLIVNSQSYTLAGDLPALAAAINTSDGPFALANDYDAKQDFFKHSPVDDLGATLEGLGHTIRHFKLHGGSYRTAGLFGKTDSGAIIRDLNLDHVAVRASRNKLYVGGLVGLNEGTITNASIGGKVSGTYQFAHVGGLVGENQGIIERSHSGASVSAPGRDDGTAGGLVGVNWGIINRSFATGPVTSANSGGGLVGASLSYTANSYATGPVSAGQGGGGFAAGTENQVSSSYSIGTVSALCAGGFVGGDGSGDALTTSYWDMDTSGIADPNQGACSPPGAPGITGLSDAQMKSGLPKGFDPSTWAINSKINHGYPYLLNNPP